MGVPIKPSGKGVTSDYSWLGSGSIDASRLRTVLTEIGRRLAALSLGTAEHGTQVGNLNAQYLTFITPGGANADFGIPHGLRRVPVGFLVVRKDKAADLYDAATIGWSSTVIGLRCDVASAAVTIAVF